MKRGVNENLWIYNQLACVILTFSAYSFAVRLSSLPPACEREKREKERKEFATDSIVLASATTTH
jgi:hypothetical protein